MRRIAQAFVAAALAWTPGVAAQDGFGSAVAVVGDEVLVAKPGGNRGAAAIYVYRADGAGWRLVERLVTEGSAARGHRLSPSIAVVGDGFVVGSASPDLRSGAHTFMRQADGWRSGPELGFGGPAGDDAVSLAGVMRILAPARRMVVAGPDLVAVSVVPAGGVADVRVFGRSGTAWTEPQALAPESPVAGFGQALALAGDGVLVGAPMAGAGQVHPFTPGAGGSWTAGTVIAPDLGERARFGAALAHHAGTLAVGAPGAATVMLYQRNDAGAWLERARIVGDTATPTAFGSAVALLGDELLVGAPRADGGAGAVHRYVRRGDQWEAAGTLSATGLAPGWFFGASVALHDRLVVVGAPLADAGRGRAALFRRQPGGALGPAEWVAPAAPPTTVTGGKVECADGVAAGFACHDVDLESFLSIEALGGRPGEGVTDLWGWTDPSTGREIALVGRTTALVFVDVTDAARPVVLGWMPANPSGARDVKVYRDHAFFTGDGAGDHGLMIFDLTRLRDVRMPPVSFTPDTVYHNIASAHNLALDTMSGFAFPVSVSGGGETCGGGLHMVDVRDPRRPAFAGCYTDTEGLISAGRTHDSQCVVYAGPDERYRGREICFASNETALRIVDVTDKANPTPLSAGKYPGMAYVHQGWLTEDQRYFYLDDELDELVGTTDRTRTMIWDVGDLEDPVMVGTILGRDGATDHNLFIKGTRMYQANYQAGFRLLDISDPTQPAELGWFDTTPYDGNPAGFYGAWTAYPFFASGAVIVSSMGEGLFVLRPRATPMVP